MAKNKTRADRELRRCVQKGVRNLLRQLRREPRIVMEAAPEGEAPDIPADEIAKWLFRR